MLATAKQIVKNAGLAALHYTGAMRVLLERRLDGRVAVLTYHRVLPDTMRAQSFSTDGIVVTPATFRTHLRTLKSLCHPLTADEFSAILQGTRAPPPRACLVTFDDGWWDNLEYALPIMAEEGVPALIFVATDHVGSARGFWQEQLARALFRLLAYGDAGGRALEKHGITCDNRNEQVARGQIRDFVTRLKARSVDEISAILQQVTDDLHSREPAAAEALHADRFMSWDDLRRMVASGIVTIGSHCKSHVPLTKLDAAHATRELRDSRDILRERLGVDAVDLAYPNGDCNADIAALAAAAGYRTAFTTERGHVAPQDHPQLLRRMNIHEGSTRTPHAFVARVAGLI